jgi:hypothetical protein
MSTYSLSKRASKLTQNRGGLEAEDEESEVKEAAHREHLERGMRQGREVQE